MAVSSCTFYTSLKQVSDNQTKVSYFSLWPDFSRSDCQSSSFELPLQYKPELKVLLGNQYSDGKRILHTEIQHHQWNQHLLNVIYPKFQVPKMNGTIVTVIIACFCYLVFVILFLLSCFCYLVFVICICISSM